MNWKDFLKPNLKKIFVFVLILSFVFFTFYNYFYVNYVISKTVLLNDSLTCSYSYIDCVRGVRNTEILNTSKINEDFQDYTKFRREILPIVLNFPMVSYPLYIMILVPFDVYDNLFTNRMVVEAVPYSFDPFISYQNLLLQFVILIVYWYLLSCVIVWLYDKIRLRGK